MKRRIILKIADKENLNDGFFFFLVGSYLPKYIFAYIPAWLILKATKGIKKRNMIDKGLLTLALGYSLFFLFLILGKGEIYLENPTTKLIIYSGIFCLLGYTSSLHSTKNQIILLAFFISGMLSNVIYITLYNYFILGTATLYGNLFNPVTDTYVNSPGWSLMLAVGNSFFIFLSPKIDKKTLKIVFFLELVLSIALGTYLGGRAFFVIYALTITLFLSSYISDTKKLFTFLTATLMVSVTAYFMTAEFYEAALSKITSKLSSGIDSPRFLLWSDGFKKMLSNPLGGFKVDQSIDNVNYFHNFWLDTARIGGWLPLTISIVLFIYPLTKTFIKKNHYNKILIPTFIICSAVFFQDVIIEGIWRLFVIFFLLSVIMATTKTNHRLSAGTPTS